MVVNMSNLYSQSRRFEMEVNENKNYTSNRISYPLCLYFEHGKTKRVTFFLPPLFSSDWSLDNFSRQMHTERFDHFLFNENNFLSI